MYTSLTSKTENERNVIQLMTLGIAQKIWVPKGHLLVMFPYKHIRAVNTRSALLNLIDCMFFSRLIELKFLFITSVKSELNKIFINF